MGDFRVSPKFERVKSPISPKFEGGDLFFSGGFLPEWLGVAVVFRGFCGYLGGTFGVLMY